MDVSFVGTTDTPQATVLMVASSGADRFHALEQSVRRARARFVLLSDAEELGSAALDARPSAIVVDVAAEAAEACTRVRDNPRLADVPVLALVDEVSDLAFADALSWGADDVVCFDDEEGLARRLRAALVRGEPVSIRRRGRAVVADPRRESRVLKARVLRNAGYDVVFALDGMEALRAAAQEGVHLVVSVSSLDGEGGSLVARARQAGLETPWVLGVSPRDLREAKKRVQGLRQVAVYDAFGPADNLVFVANELTRGESYESRSSARLLFGATVLFRSAGADADERGYCHNVSERGLYVRTLAPLPRGTQAWLELRPPRSDRRVRLEGQVVWTRGLGTHETATNPPGMGLQLQGSAPAEWDRWVACYRTFASELLEG